MTCLPPFCLRNVSDIIFCLRRMAFNVRHKPIMFFIITSHSYRDQMLKFPLFPGAYCPSAKVAHPSPF